jgi:hypothetical protein
MPIVLVSGIPPHISDDSLAALRKGMCTRIASVKELGLTEDQVTVMFPAERCMPKKLEIIGHILGLVEKPERTPDVRMKLVGVVADVLKMFALGNCETKGGKVEVLLHPSLSPNFFGALPFPE